MDDLERFEKELKGTWKSKLRIAGGVIGALIIAAVILYAVVALFQAATH